MTRDQPNRERPTVPADPWPGLEPHALSVFVAVAEHGSIAAAAIALHWDSAQVSRRLLALERSLGRQGILFHRLPGRPVQLTDVGLQLRYRAEEILGAVGRAREEIADLERGVTGRVRVGSLATTSATILPAALAEYQARFRAVEVTVLSESSAENLRGVLKGNFDIAVIQRLRADDHAPAELELHDLLVDRMLVAVGENDALAGRSAPLSLADLQGRTWIQDSDSSFQQLLIDGCRETGYEPSFTLAAGSSLGWIGKQGLVARGIGLALIPEVAAAACRRDLRLLDLEPPLTRRLSVALPERPRRAAREFAACLDRAAQRWAQEERPA
jgi:DNA-binding transcriptional LysR family regulator